MITYRYYYLKEKAKKDFFEWCIENKLHKRTTVDFRSRMQLVFTEVLKTESITAIIAYHNKDIAGILLCENKMLFTNGKIYEDSTKFIAQVQENFEWGFYNLGIINIFVKPKYRNLGIAKEMIQDIEKVRLHKLAVTSNHCENGSKPLFEAQELTFQIAGKYFKNSYVSTAKSDDTYTYRQVIHSLSVKCKDKTGCKQFNKSEYKEIDLQIEENFIKPINKKKIPKGK